MEDTPPPLEVCTGPHPSASVIWLHGLGADGYDFLPVAQELDLRGLPDVRFVFPHAPMRPVTWNNGYVMPAWYDIIAIGPGAPEDETGLGDSRQRVEALIAREKERGIAPHHIVLAGFSQGGAVALFTALRHPARLAGVLALSTYLPLAARLPAEATPANRALPIFMAHGTQDGIVPLALAEASRQKLETLGHPVEWHTYAMAHTVCAAEIADIAARLRRVLA
ncbi:alpha/beta hydrolase [Thiobacter aerophilum]|uniref:Dienelactone hydrolase family protein n=1 Tax=Thiobacter aerophilum TaxID=3121275 RepID=A0ABV0EEX0_9BURK